MTPDEVRAWRTRWDLTQSEMAAVLGVHYTTIQRWERGAVPIPPFLGMALETYERRLRVNERERNRQRRVRAERRAAAAS